MNRQIDPALRVRMGGPQIHKSASLQNRIVEELGRRIVGGAYAPDCPLPTETELAQELEISRSVLREAIKGLAARGMIESRPKIGTRIRPRHFWNRLDPDVLRWCLAELPGGESLRQLFELRLIFEPAAAAYAAERRSEQELRRLKRAFHGMALSDTAEESILSDLEFHMTILEASGNELILSLGNVISLALLDLFKLGQSTWEAEGNQWLDHHERVMLAIEAQDGETARSIMHELLSDPRQCRGRARTRLRRLTGLRTRA
ncbi:MAG: FadR/GntR family transcriptional regulator [Geminicoccaceae bacterium]